MVLNPIEDTWEFHKFNLMKYFKLYSTQITLIVSKRLEREDNESSFYLPAYTAIFSMLY